MKTNFKWDPDKAALYFMFSVMGFCLVFSLGWAIINGLQENFIKPKVAQTFTVITEDNLNKLVKEELSAFRSEYKDEELLLVVKEFNSEEAVKHFTENSNSVMLLSRPLTEAELVVIPKFRLPVTQDTVAQIGDLQNPVTLYLIKNNLPSKLDQDFAIFMLGKKGQDVVMKNGFRPGKKSLQKLG